MPATAPPLTETTATAELPAVLGADSPLPRVQDFPGREAVIFDGKCRFCMKQVQRLARWDRRGRLAFVSLHDPWVSDNYPQLTYDQLMAEMYVVDRFGICRGGAAAFRYLSRKLPRLWLLAPLMHIPFTLPLWKWMYRQIAKRRYRISQKMGQGCDSDQCQLHF